jgi:hypothetical protein
MPLKPFEVDEGKIAPLAMLLGDSGFKDQLMVRIDWGDNTSNTTALAAGTRSYQTTHIYSNVGIAPGTNLTMRVTVTDDDGGSSSATVGVFVRTDRLAMPMPTLPGLPLRHPHRFLVSPRKPSFRIHGTRSAATKVCRPRSARYLRTNRLFERN